MDLENPFCQTVHQERYLYNYGSKIPIMSNSTPKEYLSIMDPQKIHYVKQYCERGIFTIMDPQNQLCLTCLTVHQERYLYIYGSTKSIMSNSTPG